MLSHLQEPTASAGGVHVEIDDSVFDTSVPLAEGRRWMRGAMSRFGAEDELRARGMADGRFLIRLKKRDENEVSLALSYTFKREFFHHIVSRKRVSGQLLLTHRFLSPLNTHCSEGG
jgi:hypothetical protein